MFRSESSRRPVDLLPDPERPHRAAVHSGSQFFPGFVRLRPMAGVEDDHPTPVAIAVFSTEGEARVVQAKLRAYGISSALSGRVEGGLASIEGEAGVLVEVSLSRCPERAPILGLAAMTDPSAPKDVAPDHQVARTFNPRESAVIWTTAVLVGLGLIFGVAGAVEQGDCVGTQGEVVRWPLLLAVRADLSLLVPRSSRSAGGRDQRSGCRHCWRSFSLR